MENVIERIRSTSKPGEKKDILYTYQHNEFFKYLIYCTYEPFLMYHVNIKKNEVPVPGEESIVDLEKEVRDLLSFCSESKSNQQNREKVVELLAKMNAGSQDLLLGVIGKNLKCGVSSKAVYEVFPGMISRFDVQLANTFSRDKEYKIDRWEWSHKLDGLRCIALRLEDWTLYTRKGKEFLTVEHLKPQLERLYQKLGYTMFDGELYRHGLSFEQIQGLCMGFKQGQSPELQYHTFIGGQSDWFLDGTNETDYTTLKKGHFEEAKDVYFVNEGYVYREGIEDVLEESFIDGYEGIMLRDPAQPYDYKRSNAILKLKKSLDEEYSEEITSDCTVLDIEIDDFPVITDGVMAYEPLLVRLVVEQEDGVICKVGSGFSLDFRRFYTRRPELIKGKIVEITHQKWGSNKRMRFPRLSRVREDL